MAANSQISTNWITFSAFNGRLDSAIICITGDEDSVQGKVDFLYKFLDDLFAEPALFAIPDQYHESLGKLKAAFWPAEEFGQGKTIRASFDAGTTIVRPISVLFGPDNNTFEIEIADAANALGYIFSVATPPDHATWEGYLYPLVITFSWCVALLFVRHPTGGRLDTARFPQTACLMYHPRFWQQGEFFLGSTYHVNRQCLPTPNALSLDEWRRQLLVQEQPQYVEQLLRMDDHLEYKRARAKRLLCYICHSRGINLPQDVCEDFFSGWLPVYRAQNQFANQDQPNDRGATATQQTFSGLRPWLTAQIGLSETRSKGRSMLVPDNYLAEAKLWEILEPILSSIIENRSVEAREARVEKWKEFLGIILKPLYRIPHSPIEPFDVQGEAATLQLEKAFELATQPQKLANLDLRLRRACIDACDPADRLHQIFYDNPFGRCAEIGPLKALTAEWSKLDTQPVGEHLRQIQGVSLSSLRVAMAVRAGEFDQKFSLEHMRGMDPSPFKPRCDRCLKATRSYHCHLAQEDVYDRDAKQLGLRL